VAASILERKAIVVKETRTIGEGIGKYALARSSEGFALGRAWGFSN
jgi:hypothetical protein